MRPKISAALPERKDSSKLSWLILIGKYLRINKQVRSEGERFKQSFLFVFENVGTCFQELPREQGLVHISRAVDNLAIRHRDQ